MLFHIYLRKVQFFKELVDIYLRNEWMYDIYVYIFTWLDDCQSSPDPPESSSEEFDSF